MRIRLRSLVAAVIASFVVGQDARVGAYPNLDCRLESAWRRGEAPQRRVVVTTSPVAACERAAREAGMRDVRVGPGWADGYASPDALRRLGEDPRVRWARPAFAVVPAIGNGIALTNAPAQHALGNAGAGVKIVVIDPEFGQFAAAQAAGYIPANITTIGYGAGEFGAGGNHGVSCLKIVTEMAPGAQLFAAQIESDVDAVLAAQWAVANGCQIASNSWLITSGNYWGPAGDLTHQMVSILEAGGCLPVFAAGNQAQRHQNGLVVDADADGFHDWASGASIPANVNSGTFMTLSWDAWPATDIDYDLELLNGSGAVIAAGTNVQNGTQQPYEEIYWTGGSVSGASLRVKIVNLPAGASHRRFELHLFGGSYPSGSQQIAGSIALPACIPNTLSVAALHVSNWPNGAIASYSSQGPSPEDATLAKPDITAPSAVTDPYYGTFAGTSAACPHAAGAAALFLAMEPSLASRPGALKSFVLAHADAAGLSTAGAPYVYGLGRLTLPSTVYNGYVGSAVVAPVTPKNGQVMTISIVGGPPNLPLTAVFDAFQSPPVPFGAAALHVNPLFALVLIDGVGAFGPATPTSFDATGTFGFPPLARPVFGLFGCRVQAGWINGANIELSTPLVLDL